MNGSTFVANWRDLKDELLDAFVQPGASSDVSMKIRALELRPDQADELRGILDAVMRDTMYTLLLGLDGAASIGRDQQRFKITAENGETIESIEEEAWKCFHGGSTS